MDRVKFKINGVQHSVGSEVSSDVTLLDYIRDTAELRGTKYMCREAGCGACIISIVKRVGGIPVAMSVNSCMVSVTSCQDWEITTIEKVGNRLKGYSPLQTTLAAYNGTQCGYCTPGWIMALYGLLQSKQLTMLEIEKSFGSNICRCTGYRPILEAFKRFAKDATKSKLPDIEDLSICKNTGKDCKKNCDEADWCFVSEKDVAESVIEIHLRDDKKWFRVNNVSDLFRILHREGDDSYMLVAGNTAKGVYPIDEYPRILIDISEVTELKGFTMDQNLVVGAENTLTEFIEILQHMSTDEDFEYLKKLYEHLNLVAHYAVRNIGTIAGNLMIKHQHNEFQSDVFLLLETVGAQLIIFDGFGTKHTVTMEEFLQMDMTGMVITKVLLPPLNNEYYVVTFKVMPRSQNAHAIVNAGFLYKLRGNHGTVLECRLVFGGLSPIFNRAIGTEFSLTGKDLFTNETLQSAIRSLKNELIVTEMPPEPSVEYRKQLAINLFYKGLLTLCPSQKLMPCYRSGVVRLHESRPISSAIEVYDTKPSLWPLNQPVQKLEALIQCSGEAPYTEDLPSFPQEVFAQFVLSTVPSGNIIHIDATKALNEHGVIAFYTAKDIPGLNSFTPEDAMTYIANEEVLSGGLIRYFNQPIAIVVAATRQIAERAAKMVDVTYSHVTTPVIHVKEAVKDPNRITLYRKTDATSRGTDTQKVIKNDVEIYGQYHFTMELLVCVTKPTEEGLEVHAATQWIDGIQLMISRALNMDQNRIDVKVRRVGGAYGIKISRMTRAAVASGLVSKKLNRPCRFIVPMSTITRAEGKRFPAFFEYEVGVSNSGVIQYSNCNLFEDNGYMINEQLSELGVDEYNNCYDKSKWNYRLYDTITDNAKNTWCRSPGTLENITMAETIVEQISYELSLDPVAVRLSNLDPKYSKDLTEMITTLTANSHYTERRYAVSKFNIENRWKKRGLRMSVMRWTPSGTIYLDIHLSVYHGDGTVAITHSGIEIGQGINTKAAQICAYLLGIPVDKISIKPNDTMVSANSFATVGSKTTQNVGIGVQRACKQLLDRLAPIRTQMNNPSWEELIKKAFDSGMDLQAHGFVSKDLQMMDIFGVTLAEVEVDVLTGEFEILRVDLIQDVGQSVNPEIDVGQVEGAFIMGLGYWTTEHLVYDEHTGELLTDRTWNYYVPQARDIPQNFNVYFRKNSYSTTPAFGAKMTGEPSLCMAKAIPFAIREAVAAARLDSGIPSTEWFKIDGPYTTERIGLATATRTNDFKFC